VQVRISRPRIHSGGPCCLRAPPYSAGMRTIALSTAAEPRTQTKPTSGDSAEHKNDSVALLQSTRGARPRPRHQRMGDATRAGADQRCGARGRQAKYKVPRISSDRPRDSTARKKHRKPRAVTTEGSVRPVQQRDDAERLRRSIPDAEELKTRPHHGEFGRQTNGCRSRSPPRAVSWKPLTNSKPSAISNATNNLPRR